MARGYTVTIYRRNLSAQFQNGGQGYRWLDKVKREMHRMSVAEAPSRTNTLRAAHRSYVRGINQYACRATIENVADHADWVHDGTSGSSGNQRVPRARGPVRGAALPRSMVFYTKEVRGQDANPWLDRACTAVAIRFGGVPYG